MCIHPRIYMHTQVENFYTKVVDDLESELTNLDPTVPIRSVLEEHDEQQAEASAADYNTPWVMRGASDHVVELSLFPRKVRMHCVAAGDF